MPSKRSFALFVVLAVVSWTGASSADEPVRPLVHIEATSPVRLERRTPAGTWEIACASPCDRPLPADDTYRVVDGAEPPGGPLRLVPEPDGTVWLTVRAPSSSKKRGGVTKLVVGGVLVVASLVGIGLAVRMGSEPTCGWCSPDNGGVDGLIALMGLTGSAIGIVVGGVLLVGGASSYQAGQGSVQQARALSSPLTFRF